MSQTTRAPYGSWASPITTDLLTRGTVGLGQVALDGDAVYWTEQRPWEQGRTVLVRRDADGVARDLTPTPYNVRSKVHEYGGGAMTAHDGIAWFVDARDQRVHRVEPDGRIAPLTPADGTAYADLTVDAARGRLIAVAETPPGAGAGGGGEPENRLVAIAADGRVDTLAEGADFYAMPALSPDGERLAWIEWRHPNMPWDGTACREARLDADGAVVERAHIAGGPNVSVFQPGYAPDGTLYYVSDESGFWNLHRHGQPPRRFAVDAEFGQPHWQFGMRTYGFLDEKTAVCAYCVAGDWRLGVLDLQGERMAPLDLPGGWTAFDGVRTQGTRVAFAAGRPDGPGALVLVDARTGREEVLRTASDIDLPPAAVSRPEKIAFPTTGERTAYAYFYPPASADHEGPAGELPPLIVMSHGGPTGQAVAAFSLKVQFWTSRGFAVVDVNYGGSTGFGRAYRERLAGNWGVVDVDDCVNAAQYLADEGRVDGDRLVTVGGSAGGYTTLAALTFRDVFKAGRSSYGIGDLETLARDTHKFESRYLDQLIGPWPEAAETYRARSPINHTERLSCPVIFLQGGDDKVVPPNQAEAMVAALREKGLPVAYLLFEGEGHGFRRADSIQRAYEAELGFYARLFGFTPADDIAPVEIENMA